MALNDKQRRFVDEYLVDLNATKAAERAGYSPKTAGSQGFDLLKKPEIQAAVSDRMQARARRTEITQDRVLQEIARIAFFDPRNLFDKDGQPLPIASLDSDTAAVLAGLDVVEEYLGTGEDRKFIGFTKKYKIADKLKALDQCMSHLGMGKQKVELTGADGAPLALTIISEFPNE